MLAKKTVKNQITLPKAILNRLPKTNCFEVILRGEEIVLKPVNIGGYDSNLGRARARIKALGLTEKDINKAIRWAKGR